MRTGYAGKEMLPALEEIWRACFGDGGYVRLVFDRLLAPGGTPGKHRILVAGDGDAPEAMLCLEPFTLASGGEEGVGAYVFGVATHPHHQGKGLITRLLEDCHARLKQAGYHLSALVPASESLFGFYEQRGYTTAFDLWKGLALREKLPAASGCWRAASRPLADLEPLRNRFYGDRRGFVRWNRDWLAYIGAEADFAGGGVVSLTWSGGEGYGVCHKDGDQLVVKELAVPDKRVPEALGLLCDRYACTRCRVYLPADSVVKARIWEEDSRKALPFGSVKWYDKKKRDAICRIPGKAPWIAHVLD